PIAFPESRVLARTPDVEYIDLVPALGELGRQVVVGNRPESGVQPQPVTKNNGELPRIGLSGAIMPNAQPPAITRVGVTIGTRSKVRRRCVAAHRGASGRAGAKENQHPGHPPAPVHEVRSPSLGRSVRRHPCLRTSRDCMPALDFWECELLIPSLM